MRQGRSRLSVGASGASGSPARTHWPTVDRPGSEDLESPQQGQCDLRRSAFCLRRLTSDDGHPYLLADDINCGSGHDTAKVRSFLVQI